MYTYETAQNIFREADEPVVNVLGIEITDTRLAALCGLGNIDGQHGADALPDAPAAVELCLEAHLPPAQSVLATLRPDLDSIGAMALLTLRKRGIRINAAMMERVLAIGRIDRFDNGAWPGRRKLPDSLEELLSDGIGVEMSALAAASSDRFTPMRQKVDHLAAWLQTGAVPELYANAMRQQAERLFQSLSCNQTRVEERENGKIAVVFSMVPGALPLAYRYAPVIIALNPAHEFPDGTIGRKFTIASWSEKDADLNRASRAIASMETGWGGQAGIKGSPQFHPSGLFVDDIVAAMIPCLKERD